MLSLNKKKCSFAIQFFCASHRNRKRDTNGSGILPIEPEFDRFADCDCFDINLVAPSMLYSQHQICADGPMELYSCSRLHSSLLQSFHVNFEIDLTALKKWKAQQNIVLIAKEHGSSTPRKKEWADVKRRKRNVKQEMAGMWQEPYTTMALKPVIFLSVTREITITKDIPCQCLQYRTKNEYFPVLTGECFLSFVKCLWHSDWSAKSMYTIASIYIRIDLYIKFHLFAFMMQYKHNGCWSTQTHVYPMCKRPRESFSDWKSFAEPRNWPPKHIETEPFIPLPSWKIKQQQQRKTVWPLSTSWEQLAER